MPTALDLDREALAAWYVRNRERSEAIFDSVRPEAYESRPIALRNPICFYEGHLPAFAVNTLVKLGLGGPGSIAAFEMLFERGIDPEDEKAVPEGDARRGPRASRSAATRAAADRAVLEALAEARHRGRGRIPCSPAAWPRTRSSSTSRCTRRRSSTCCTGCPTTRRSARSLCRRRPDRRASRPSARSVRIPGRPATLGADPARSRSAGTTSFRGTRSRSAPSTIDVDSVTNRDFLEFVEADGYETRRSGSDEGWSWRARHEVRHPLFWELHRGVWFWRGHVGPGAAADGLARLRHRTRRRRRTRAGRAGACRPRRSSTARRSERRAARERAHPWGDDAARRDAGQLRLRGLRIPVPVGSFPARRERLGRARSRRQRLGVDVHGLRAVSGVRADGVLPAVLGRLLRRQALRAEGRLAGDAEGARPPQLPQLVPRDVPVRLREVPDGGPGDAIPSSAQAPPAEAVRDFAEDVRRDLALSAEAAPVEVPLQRPRLRALRGDLPPALVPDHARRGAAARAVRPGDGRTARRPDHASSSSAAAAARSSPCSPRRCASAASACSST